MSRCMFQGCVKDGERLDLGYGFVFCPDHETRARTVLRGGKLVEVPKKIRTCQRGHLVVGPNVGTAEKCRACANANSAKHANPDLDKAEFSDARYEKFMAGTRWARKKVAA